MADQRAQTVSCDPVAADAEEDYLPEFPFCLQDTIAQYLSQLFAGRSASFVDIKNFRNPFSKHLCDPSFPSVCAAFPWRRYYYRFQNGIRVFAAVPVLLPAIRRLIYDIPEPMKTCLVH